MDPTATDPIIAPTRMQNTAGRLTIRRIVPEDAEAAALLSGQLGYECATGQMLQRIQRLSGCANNQAVFVACLQDKETSRLVGWIEVATAYHLQSEPFVLIGGLVVLEGLRGLGIPGASGIDGLDGQPWDRCHSCGSGP